MGKPCFLGLTITAGRDCSHEIKRRLLLGRKAITSLDNILKSRDVTLPTKVHIVKASLYSCHVWMGELDLKKAELQRIDAFKLWYWRRLLRVPQTARRSIQSILREISPEYSLQGLMLKLKLQYFGHLMQRTDSFEKTLLLERLKAGREGDDRGWAGWMATPTPWTWVWVSSWSGDKQGSLACCNLCGCKESDTTQRLNWSNVEDIYTANRGLILIQFLLPSSDANEHARCLLTKLSVSIQEGLGIPPCSWSLLEAREIYDATDPSDYVMHQPVESWLLLLPKRGQNCQAASKPHQKEKGKMIGVCIFLMYGKKLRLRSSKSYK